MGGLTEETQGAIDRELQRPTCIQLDCTWDRKIPKKYHPGHWQINLLMRHNAGKSSKRNVDRWGWREEGENITKRPKTGYIHSMGLVWWAMISLAILSSIISGKSACTKLMPLAAKDQATKGNALERSKDEAEAVVRSSIRISKTEARPN